MQGNWGSGQDDYNYLFKIVLVGDSGVGKSCLLSRFAWDQFSLDSKSTIGVEFATKSLLIGGQTVKVQVWDTAGQERYRAITTAYYRDALGAIILYDITNQESFNNVARWVQDVRNNSNNKNINIMLLGNKSDLVKQRKVPADSGKLFSRNNELRNALNPFFTGASALDSTNVESAFTSLVTEIYHGVSQRGITEGVGEFAKPGPGTGRTLHLTEPQQNKEKPVCCKML